MKKLTTILTVLLLAAPAITRAEATVDELQQKIAAITDQLQQLTEKVEAQQSPAESPPSATNSEVMAAINELREQVAAINEELNELSDTVDEEVEDLWESADASESHVALDRVTFTGDFRATADTLHYRDVTWNPGIKVNFTDFFNKVGASLMPGVEHPLGEMNVFVPDAESPLGFSFDPGASQGTALDNLFVDMFNNDPAQFNQLMGMMANYMMTGQEPGVGNYAMAQEPRISDINNDILYTTRLRLNLRAPIAKNMNFSGRLLMYKNWGDTTTSKVFDSWNAFTMDGTNGGSTTGDWLRVERAYFDWKDIGGTDFYLSIGRRPSTYGTPTNYRENEMRGGTPSGHLVNFNFDGITIGYHMEDLTGIEGMAVRFCYGQGYESEWGNGELFNQLETTSDTHLGGFNIDLLNNGKTFVSLTLFRAQDIVDGFKGTFAFPTQFVQLFAPTLYADVQKFPTFNFNTRYTPSTTIGSMNLAGIGFSREEDNGFVWFASVSLTQLQPNGQAGMFGGLGTDAVFEAKLSTSGEEVYMVPVGAEDDDSRTGYGVYAGIQVPVKSGKFGLEYNYGSKYWTPFTQAQDDPLGSKLATRGHVGEAYYIYEINSNAFITLGGLFYDFEYTGSGSPVGKPVKIEDVQSSLSYSLLPVVDTAWDLYAKISMRF